MRIYLEIMKKNQLCKFIKLISMERNLFLTQLNNYYSYNNNLHCDIEVRGLKLKNRHLAKQLKNS